MATYSKEVLSGSTLGKGIDIDQTLVGSAVTVHTVDSALGTVEEIWIYAHNYSGGAIDLTLWWGGIVAGEHDIIQSIPSKSGLTLVTPGLILEKDATAALIVKATASSATAILLFGYVNRVNP
jgi:hypothetical protein